MSNCESKYRVLFPFVEAGLGHIMPMRAIADAFEKKYGDRAEVVRVNFFQVTGDPNLKYVEDELVKEVKLHNKHKIRGSLQFFFMNLVGGSGSMKYVMEKHYKRGFAPAMELIQSYNADLIFNTHFSTFYYACEAKERGLIDAQVAGYCPDPVIGQQWDNRVDLMALSSEVGKARALKSRTFTADKLCVIPFLIRDEVKTMDKGRAYYRKELGLPEDKFTVLLADGAYGAGKLGATVRELLKSDKEMTVVAVCGKNERLYNEFLQLKSPDNITFVPYGFTDKMLKLSASCDLFVGKAGASNLAEPAYFGAPSIVTFRATPVEKWIAEHFVKHTGCAILEENIKRAVRLIEKMATDPEEMKPYQTACKAQHRHDGPEMLADRLWGMLVCPSEGKQQEKEKSKRRFLRLRRST